MFRRLILGLATAAFLATPATAAVVLFRSPDVTVDWGHKSLAKLKCEDAATIADMAQTFKGMRFADGTRALSDKGKVTITNSRTVRAQADQLACRIRLTATDNGFGSVAGEISVRLRGGGKWDVYFKDID